MGREDTIGLQEYFETKVHFIQELAKANDRRYTEVNIEKEKALKIKDEGDREARRIKDEADKTALGLAREIQTYKDEKANNLRTQIESERGSYATKADLTSAIKEMQATIKPLTDYVSSQQGRSGGYNQGWIYLTSGLAAMSILIMLFFALSGHIH